MGCQGAGRRRARAALALADGALRALPRLRAPLSQHHRIPRCARARRVRGPRGARHLPVGPESPRVVPGAMSSRARGKGRGRAPDHAAKECHVMTRRAGSLLLLLAALVSTVGTSEAGNLGGVTSKEAVLYELMEQAEFTEDGFRNATSALEGKVLRGTPICPDGLQAYAKIAFATVGIKVQVAPRCTVVAIGQSQINIVSDPPSGKISGDFWIVVNSDATNLADAQELV